MKGSNHDMDSAMDILLEHIEQEHNDTELALEAYDSVRKKLGLSSRKKVWDRFVCRSKSCAWILVLALTVGFVMLLPKSSNDVEWQEVNVRAGTKQEVILPDGTSLVMSAGSRVTYPSSFEGEERQIFVDGEIFANVTHDKDDRPFVVRSGEVSVTVLGTTFNLQAYRGTKEVCLHLLEGSVRMDVSDGSQESSCMVRPGQYVVYNREDGILKSTVFDVDSYRTIKATGHIEFDNMSILDIATELERMFGKKIVIADKKLASRRMSAYFMNDESLDEIIASLNMDGKMNVDSASGVYYLSSR